MSGFFESSYLQAHTHIHSHVIPAHAGISTFTNQIPGLCPGWPK